MADKTRHKIKNLLQKLNDEDRNTLCCLLHMDCSRCGHPMNTGLNYQPRYCDQCGQRVSFNGVIWKEDRHLGYAGRRDVHESVEDRMV